MFKKILSLILCLAIMQGILLWQADAVEDASEFLKVTSVTFTNTGNETVRSITNGKSVKVNAKVYNSSKDTHSATVWVGVYSNDILKSGKYQTLDVSAENTQTFSITTDPLSSADIIKVHFWSGENELSSYGATAVFPSSDTGILNMYVDGILCGFENNKALISCAPGTVPNIEFEMKDSGTEIICNNPITSVPGTAVYKFKSSDGTERSFTVEAVKSSLTRISGGKFNGYYLIAENTDFELISKDVYGNYAVSCDITKPVTASIPSFYGKLVGINDQATDYEMREVAVSINGSGLFSKIGDGAGFEHISLTGNINGSGLIGVGGFAGIHDTAEGTVTFSNCINNASVSGSGRVGGFIGDSFHFGFITKINNCVNNGNITAGSEGSVGGFIGISQIDSEITGAVNTGDIIGSQNNAGGIIGWSYGQMIINKCYNTGNVSSKAYVGGIAGIISRNAGTVIANCFNTGEISGTQSGFSPAAGIVGRCEEAITIENSYNIGKLSSAGNQIFQIIHVKTAGIETVNNCYYLSEEDVNVSIDGAIPRKTADLIALADVLNGTDGTAWVPSSDTEIYPYPELKGMPYKGEAIEIVEELKTVLGGTYDGYYIISSAKHFKNIEENPSGKYVITKDITTAITKPISAFSGELIGVNESATAEEMRTVNVDISQNGDIPTGLFQRIGAVKIKNIILNGSVTNTGNTGSTGVGGFAGLAGSAGTATFENCINNARISGGTYVGGIMGSSNLWQFVPVLINCKNTGEISASSSTAGGMMGFGQASSVINKCVNTGKVSSVGNNVGGIIGWSYGTLTLSESYNAGSITGNAYAGGLVGIINKNAASYITDCFNAGTITGTQAGFSPAGGLVGRTEVSVSLENCYNAGTVSAVNIFQIIHEKSAGLSSVTNCYYLSESDVSVSSDGGIPQNSAALKALAAELNGPDRSVWVSSSNPSVYPYPELSGMAYEGTMISLNTVADSKRDNTSGTACNIRDLLFGGVIAKAAEVSAFTAEQAEGKDSIKVSGSNTSEANIVIDVAVLSEGKSIKNLTDMFKSNSEGSISDYIINTKKITVNAGTDYEVSVDMPSDAVYGGYVVADTLKNSVTLSFANVNDVLSALQAIVSAAKNNSENEMKTALKDIGKIGADTGIYGRLTGENNIKLVTAVLLSNNGLKLDTVTLDDIDSIRMIVDSSLVLPGFNCGLIKSIEKYEKDICPDGTTGELNQAMADYLKSTISDKGKEYVISSISNNAYSDMNELRNDFVKAVILKTVKYPVNGYQDIENALRNFSDEIGITMSSYNALGNKNSVLSALHKGEYATLKELAAAFRNAVGKAGGVTNSGGGGGGGGGASYNKPETSDGTIGNVSVVVPSGSNTAPVNSIDNFKDSDDAVWAKDAMQNLLDKKILSGYGDNTLKPNNTITREEFIKLLIAAFYSVDYSAKTTFTDIPDDSWCYSYVASAEKYGITKGKGNSLFGLGELISRQDMAVMICNYLKSVMSIEKIDSESFTDDANISEYAKESVYALKSMNILSGYQDGSFLPEGSATRAEASRIIYNIMLLAD